MLIKFILERSRAISLKIQLFSAPSATYYPDEIKISYFGAFCVFAQMTAFLFLTLHTYFSRVTTEKLPKLKRQGLVLNNPLPNLMLSYYYF